MEYLAADRGQNQPLIRCQVELDLRPSPGGRGDGASICNLALAARAASGVFVDIEFNLIGGDVEAGLLGDLADDFLKYGPQEFLVDVAPVA